jgi:hypothetical protein
MITPEQKERFLAILADTANVFRSARRAGLNRQHLYRLRRTDEEFAKLWDEAVELGTCALEDEAVRRSYQGCLKPTKYGMVREFSDTLLVLLLKARRRAVYGDKVDSNVNLSGTIDWTATAERLNGNRNEVERLLEAKAAGLDKPKP